MSGKLKRTGCYLILTVFCVVGIFVHMRVIFGGRSLSTEWSFSLPEISVATVRSGSMSPELGVGDLVLIAETDDYQTGDIVEVFDENQTRLLHRLIIYEPYADIALTQGDANSAADEPIRCSAIKGELLFKLPGVGTVIDWFQTMTGHLILTMAALFLFLSVLWSMFRRKSGMDKTNDSAEVDSDSSEICCQKTKTRRIGMIGLVVVLLLLVTLAVFSVSQIFAFWRSGTSGTFSMQARPSVTETDSFGIDEVYVRVE